MTRGLPQKDALETILRDSLATDTCDPAGIYFGTRSGKVYGSSDDGKSWRAIMEGLPPVVCVRAALVGDGTASPRRRGGAEKTKARKKGLGAKKKPSKQTARARSRAAKR